MNQNVKIIATKICLNWFRLKFHIKNMWHMYKIDWKMKTSKVRFLLLIWFCLLFQKSSTTMLFFFPRNGKLKNLG